MPDFPDTASVPQRVSFTTFSQNCLCAVNSMEQNLVASAGTAWPANNRALYVPVWIEKPMVGRRMYVGVITSSGNLDVGIYDFKGNRIVSKGSTAMAAAGTQIIDITTGVTGTASPVLMPGTYFLALVVSTTAASMKASTLSLAEMCRICGIQQENLGATTLPATATFSNPASAYAPAIGLSSSATL